MPKTNCDYSRTVMYKIVCNDLSITDCYIGHTTDFIKRKCRHKRNCTHIDGKQYNIYIYKFIRQNGGWNNWSMIEIEKYVCSDGNEARARERFWYEQLNSTLNSDIPGRTVDEHREYNMNKCTEYNLKNRLLLNEKARLKTDCPCGGKYTNASKMIHYNTNKHIDYINSLVV